MNKGRFGFISIIVGVAVVALGTVIYFHSSETNLLKYYAKAIIENVDEKDQAVVVDGYKMNGNHKETIALDQLKPNQTIDIVYEYPNDLFI